MKYIAVFTLIILYSPVFAQVAQTSTDSTAPHITFDSDTVNFGTLVQGQTIRSEFKFRNTGKSPLVICEGNESCPCTVVEYPKEPIRPGGTGVVYVLFNSSGRMGYQDKTATITICSTYQTVVLHQRGVVTIDSLPLKRRVTFRTDTFPEKFRVLFDSAHVKEITLDTVLQYIMLSSNNGRAGWEIRPKFGDYSTNLFIDLYDGCEYHEFYDSHFILYHSRKLVKAKIKHGDIHHTYYYQVKDYRNGKCYHQYIYIHRYGGF